MTAQPLPVFCTRSKPPLFHDSCTKNHFARRWSPCHARRRRQFRSFFILASMGAIASSAWQHPPCPDRSHTAPLTSTHRDNSSDQRVRPELATTPPRPPRPLPLVGLCPHAVNDMTQNATATLVQAVDAIPLPLYSKRVIADPRACRMRPAGPPAAGALAYIARHPPRRRNAQDPGSTAWAREKRLFADEGVGARLARRFGSRCRGLPMMEVPTHSHPKDLDMLDLLTFTRLT